MSFQESDASYDALSSLEMQYFFKKSKGFNHFFTGSLTNSFPTDGKSLVALSLGVGTRYDKKAWNMPLFYEASIGGLYYQEKFSTQLTDRTANSTSNIYGLAATLGIGYSITDRVDSKFFIKQYASTGTSVGLGVSYSF